MPAQNDYQTFGVSGVSGTNKLPLANYITDLDRVNGNGFTTPMIRSQLHNKVLEQTSKISAAVAQFIANTGIAVNDTDAYTAIASNLLLAIQSLTLNTSGNYKGKVGIAANTTLTNSQIGSFVEITGTTAYTTTLPSPLSANIQAGSLFYIWNNSTVTQTITTPSALFYGDVVSGKGTATTTILAGQFLEFVTDGANWNVSGNTSNVSLSCTGNSATATNSSYLGGILANAYALLASPTFTGTVALPGATSIGSTTATELSYVHGVTSSIQTQLNNISNVAIGVSQTLTNTALATSAGSTNVINSSTRPMLMVVYAYGSSSATLLTLTIDGILQGAGYFGTGAGCAQLFGIVMPGKTAVINANTSFSGGSYTKLS